MENKLKTLDHEPAITSASSRFAAEPHSGQSIRFRLGDVYAPSLEELHRQMTPSLELEGEVILLSDGDTEAAYALVEVPGVLLPLIVPTSCLQAVTEGSSIG